MYNEETCRFLKTHEWAFAEGENAVVGISNHAQEEISDIVFVDLPKVGRVVKAGENCCVIESVKSASEIYAPVSGEIIAVNEALNGDPALVNREPHAGGWLFKIKMSDPSEMNALLDLAAYNATIGK
ncbi:MAG: glycine cleavage system protein GcvH [Elusimicrobiaceae bacterium]|nr:glycine cleavage system protein GcvH [Elusimicrobiaceae bacterium]